MTSFAHRSSRPHVVRFPLLVAALALIAAAVTWTLLAHSPAPPSPPPDGVPRVASATGGGALPAGRMSPDLARIAAARPGQGVEVIAQFRRGVNVAQARALVRAVGGQPGIDLHIINALSARLSAGAGRRLAASPQVRTVSLNAPIVKQDQLNFNPWQLATNFDRAVGATRLWNQSTGSGVGVAVIDTGVAGDLPDFRHSQQDTSSRVVSSAVVDPNASTAADNYGHGTAVGGLVAGNGGNRDAGDPEWGQYAGTAPNANLVSVKISDDTGQATTLDAIYGLQFAVDHKSDYNIHVVNMSFRSTSAESYTTDPLDAAAESAWLNGITVVAAAGNLGSQSDAVSYAPGNDPYVITVGATDTQGTTGTWDDRQTDWSSRGVTQDGVAKPDVLAPGAHIVTTLAPGSAFSTLCPTCIVGGSYFQVSGTSLAAPIVSGLAADLIAAHPNWTPAMVKGAIVHTAVPLFGGGSEVDGSLADWANGGQLTSDQNVTPNGLIDPSTGAINYNSASWSAGSWSTATDPLAASWSAASWSCNGCSSTDSSGVSPTSASWSNLGWATYWG